MIEMYLVSYDRWLGLIKVNIKGMWLSYFPLAQQKKKERKRKENY